MQMQRENAKQYIILREFYLQQMRIFVTQNRMDLTLFGYATSQNPTKIHQKCIRSRVRAVLTQQIFSIPKAFPAGHIGDMSKGKDEGIEKICSSKPTWFDSRTANGYSIYILHQDAIFVKVQKGAATRLRPFTLFTLLDHYGG